LNIAKEDNSKGNKKRKEQRLSENEGFLN